MYCYLCGDKTKNDNKFCCNECRETYRILSPSIKRFLISIGRQTKMRKKIEAEKDKYKITAKGTSQWQA